MSVLRRKKYYLIAGVLIAVLLAVSAVGLYRNEKLVRSIQGVTLKESYLGKTDISGLTKEELEKKITSVQDSIMHQKLTVISDDNTYEFERNQFVKNCSYKVTFIDLEKSNSFESIEELADWMTNLSSTMSDRDLLDCLKGKKPFPKTQIVIEAKLNSKKIRKVVNEIQTSENSEASNAYIDAKGKFVKEKDGKRVDTDSFENYIISFAAAMDQNCSSYSLVFDKVKPTCTVKDLKSCTECIGEYTTTFTVNDRGYNVSLGASRINNLVVAPGASVSICSKVHDNSDGKDFKSAPSYAAGKVVQTKGGGLCQVSSTLYNAVLSAGIIPAERHAHSMPVHYVPLGLDATMAQGCKDLVIENKRKTPFVIKSYVNGGSLTIKVFAKKGFKGGKTYKTRTESLGANHVRVYYDTYKNGKLIDSITLHTDRYK